MKVMASLEPGASAAIWRGVATFASRVRYMVTPVDATTHVLAYLPIDGWLGKPALRWALLNPNRSSAVMVEWATGRNVPRWDAVVRDAANRLRRR